MGDSELVGELGRRGTTAEERIAQAEERIRHWTRKLEEARTEKRRAEAADCEGKIGYWTARLRGLIQRMAQHPA